MEEGTTPHFECSRCGACCEQLKEFGDLYADLDGGDGACVHYDPERKLCSIYETRPLKCRVEEGWQVYFSDIPYTEYLAQTYEGCRKLQAIKAQRQSGSAAGKKASQGQINAAH